MERTSKRKRKTTDFNSWKKPDVKAPRRRPSSYKIVNPEFYNRLCEELPDIGAKYSYGMIKKIIRQFHEQMVQRQVLDTRDGVELPLLMGHIFLGVFNPRSNNYLVVDEGISCEYKQEIHSDNYHSDSYIGKIYYTVAKDNDKNNTKVIENGKMWCFDACRIFSRGVKPVLIDNWKKYAVVTFSKSLHSVVRKNQVKAIMKNKRMFEELGYDEFKFD